MTPRVGSIVAYGAMDVHIGIVLGLIAPTVGPPLVDVVWYDGLRGDAVTSLLRVVVL